MSADKDKKTPKSSELLSWIWGGYNHERAVSGKLTKHLQRLIDLGLVRTKRRNAWSPFGSHIKRTFLFLTETGRGFMDLLAPATEYVAPPHKRSPRIEKKRDRRYRQVDE